MYMEGQLKMFRFFFFFWYWFGNKVKTNKQNQEILKQSCKDLFILEELPIVWLIGSNNI